MVSQLAMQFLHSDHQHRSLVTVFSHLLFFLFPHVPHDCATMYSTNFIVKFADDTTILGIINGSVIEVVSSPTAWSRQPLSKIPQDYCVLHVATRMGKIWTRPGCSSFQDRHLPSTTSPSILRMLVWLGWQGTWV